MYSMRTTPHQATWRGGGATLTLWKRWVFFILLLAGCFPQIISFYKTLIENDEKWGKNVLFEKYIWQLSESISDLN